MAFTELETKRIDRVVGALCARRSPAAHADKLRTVYAIKRHEVIVSEQRPRWDNPQVWLEHPIAKLKYVRTANTWHLFWRRASGRWNAYEPAATSTSLERLVAAIDEDAYGCFWG